MPAKPNKFVLLDRDGTIIVNKHYQKNPDDTELLPNARAGLDLLRASGFGLVVLTNQSGIGRGRLTGADLAAIHRRLCLELGGDDYFSGIYHCPHLPDAGCACRKPRPGMAERAARELGFDLGECCMIGDSAADIEMGKAVGAATVLVRTGGGSLLEKAGTAACDHVADDLLAAAEWLVRREGPA